MKIISQRLIRVTAVLTIMLSMMGTAAMADNTQVILIGDAAKEENDMPKEIMTRISIPEETWQLVAVVGSGMDSSSVNVSYLKKEENGI